MEDGGRISSRRPDRWSRRDPCQCRCCYAVSCSFFFPRHRKLIPYARLQASTPVLRVVVPFSLDSLDHQAPVNSAALITSFTAVTANSVASLHWALQQGCPVEIAVNVPFTDALFESFEDLLAKALTDLDSVPPIIICMFCRINLF